MSIIPNDREVFKLAFTVSAKDIDDLNHANNVAYLGWVQDAAAAHWNKVASDELRSKCMWVVVRHEIDYLLSAMEGDEVEALTWVDPPLGPKQYRFVSIRRAGDHKILAYAKSTWCLLEPATGKPKRISPEIVDVFKLKEGK